MRAVNMHEAKTNLSGLVREVREGSEPEIVICIAGEPVARLVPIAEPQPRRLGVDHGFVTIAPDFDADDSTIRALFEGP